MANVVNGADSVGGVVDRNDLRCPGELLLEIVHVQGAGFRVDPDLLDHYPPVGKLLPGTSVTLVIDLGDEHPVAGLQFSNQRLGQQKGQGGHVGAKGNFFRIAVKKVSEGLPGIVDDFAGFPAGGKITVEVSIGPHQVVNHGVDHHLRHLVTAGPVQKGDRIAVDDPL